MLEETNGEHIPQHERRQVVRLPGFVTQLDVTISAEYDPRDLDPNVLDNPALIHPTQLIDDYHDPSFWAG